MSTPSLAGQTVHSQFPRRPRGTLREAFTDASWIQDAPWNRDPYWTQSPNLLWPEDKAWVMVTEIDFDSTIVAGSPGLVADLIVDPRIEAVQIHEGADLTSNADEVNRPDA